jgi:hypothetical protein
MAEAATIGAQDVAERDAAILEHDRASVAAADAKLVLELGDGAAGRAGLHHERAHSGAAGGWVDRRPDDEESLRVDQGLVRARDEDLLSVEHPRIAVAHGGRAHVGRHGRPGMRLGESHAIQHRLVPRKARQEALLLLGRTRGGHGSGTQQPDGGAQVQGGVTPRQDLRAVRQALVGDARPLLLGRLPFGLLGFVG